MAFNEDLALRLRQEISKSYPNMVEKKMFGGLAFLYQNKMTVGIVKDDLMVRVIASKISQELTKPQVREMDFTKRPMKEFIFVSTTPDEDLSYWIKLGVEHAKSKLES